MINKLRFLIPAVCVLLAASCVFASESVPDLEFRDQQEEVEQILQSLSLSQKICQMFFITPEALTGASAVTRAGEITKNQILTCPVGGLVYFEQNLQDPDQTRANGRITSPARETGIRTGIRRKNRGMPVRRNRRKPRRHKAEQENPCLR